MMLVQLPLQDVCQTTAFRWLTCCDDTLPHLEVARHVAQRLGRVDLALRVPCAQHAYQRLHHTRACQLPAEQVSS